MDHHERDRDNGGKGMGYGRFAAMIGTSTVVMFGLMYLNTYALDHVFFSQTRMWMALYMGAAMAVIMLAFMLGMYSNRSLNITSRFSSGPSSPLASRFGSCEAKRPWKTSPGCAR